MLQYSHILQLLLFQSGTHSPKIDLDHVACLYYVYVHYTSFYSIIVYDNPKVILGNVCNETVLVRLYELADVAVISHALCCSVCGSAN